MPVAVDLLPRDAELARRAAGGDVDGGLARRLGYTIRQVSRVEHNDGGNGARSVDATVEPALVKDGYIVADPPAPKAKAAKTAKASPDTVRGRRNRIVYRLTAEGKERFHELVCDTRPEAYDDGGLFGVRLATSAVCSTKACESEDPCACSTPKTPAASSASARSCRWRTSRCRRRR